MSPAREKDLYRLVGMVLAWLLAHGGPVGNFFSGTLYDSIAYGPGRRPQKLGDVPDHDLKQKIIQVGVIFNLYRRTGLECYGVTSPTVTRIALLKGVDLIVL